jgi:hypothetical protein
MFLLLAFSEVLLTINYKVCAFKAAGLSKLFYNALSLDPLKINNRSFTP